MDNIPSIAPPSYSPPGSHSLITIVAPIPRTIPRPAYLAPAYNYQGLPFDMLPLGIQSFLASHGLGDTDNDYSTESVASIRLWLTDQLVNNVRSVCEAIAHATVRYNLLRTMYPACDPSLCLLVNLVHHTFLPMLDRHIAEHLALADALVWADVSVREGGPDALTTEQALHYRSLQTQPPIELVATHLVDLYEWSAKMWMMGWRSDGSTTYLQTQPTPDPVVSDAASPELEEATLLSEPELDPAPAELLRPGTPGCTIAPADDTSLPVEALPSRPSTPQSPALISAPQTPQSPRSLRRVGSPPTTPARTRSPPSVTQCIPKSYSFSSLQSPTKPGKYASLSLGRTLPPWWDAAWNAGIVA
ncbi:hypothetical protein C8F04DRAFT_1070005 [Mycena alexandri]|uniref:Uncharacterized protein n=1 Tax=Mycena alexandri TaxID=1745969 RepID=A0AAD6TEK4_9AGAR|nr:hypothetical protein C8F04DRAFT_1070005 [Mycena alexandri]